jgi:hypothetical protein
MKKGQGAVKPFCGRKTKEAKEAIGAWPSVYEQVSCQPLTSDHQ